MTEKQAADLIGLAVPITFVNEFGKAITLSIRRRRGAVLIDMSGPASHAQWELTELEASHLRAALATLDKVGGR